MVGEIKDDVILGMPFLIHHKCTLLFNTHELEVEGDRLKCVDREGKTLEDRMMVKQVDYLPAPQANSQSSPALTTPLTLGQWRHQVRTLLTQFPGQTECGIIPPCL